ncbi:MAG: DUF2851 family protein [Tannerella sp.]|jgi:hypothetical protein|nr:DUF2851 family protein [Tannerella sp.]
MEEMLQYVWKHRLYVESDFITTEGMPVSVIDAGIPNTDAGPDFFNAKIRIGNTMWAGNVEIHQRASDWYAHGHHKDKAYDSVALHVVGEYDSPVCRSNGELVPQAVLHIPEKVRANIRWLLSRDTPVPCAVRLGGLPAIYLSDWMAALAAERLERKASDIFVRLEKYAKDWNEIFYITLMRNFGFGTNSDAFEWLAGSLPYKYILKHRHNPLQVEALLFGQAGLLGAGESPSFITKGIKNAGTTSLPADADPYYLSLCREYEFLRKKYLLQQPVEGFLFKKLRTRPVNFPHVRIAQVAAVWINRDLLFSEIVEKEEIGQIRSLFKALPSEYWNTHYHFGTASSSSQKKTIGKNAINTLLINTVVPVLFAYGKQKRRPEYCDRALKFLEELPPERNHIARFFEKAGVSVGNAGDTQALIQLRREYCDLKKCLYCRIGFRMIDK